MLTLIAKREVNDGEAREEEVREAMKAFEASARHYENIELKDALLSAVEIAGSAINT